MAKRTLPLRHNLFTKAYNLTGYKNKAKGKVGRDLEIVTALIISGLTALFIALPFFLKSKNSANDFDEERQEDPALRRFRKLEVQKDSLYSAIRDIDLDFGLGKLTKEDYDDLRRKYRLEAAEVLKEIDFISNSSGLQDLDSEIEAEISRSRTKAQGMSLEDEIEKEISSARTKHPSVFSTPRSLSCPACGSEISADDIFCSKCGEKLTRAESV